MARKSYILALSFMAFAFGRDAQLNAQDQTKAPRPNPSAPSPQAMKPGTIENRVEQYLRNVYAWGPEYEIKVGTSKPSPVSDLSEFAVTVGKDGQSDTATVYVSKDGKFMVRGELTDMTVDPLAEIRSKLNPGNAPTLGPPTSKITLIEYADFECPSCRQLDRVLRSFLPAHPEVRLVYKDFPLTSIHPWAMTAAMAGRCAIQQDPASFWKLHDIIFDAQDVITPSNVWEKMSDFAAQLGLNGEKLRTCMADPAITQAIEKTMAEGHDLNITGTPTTFVNGRKIVGPDETLLDQYFAFESHK